MPNFVLGSQMVCAECSQYKVTKLHCGFHLCHECREMMLVKQVKKFLGSDHDLAEELIRLTIKADMKNNNDRFLAAVVNLARIDKKLDILEKKRYSVDDIKGGSMILTERKELLETIVRLQEALEARNKRVFELVKRIENLDKTIEAQGMKIRHLTLIRE